MQLEDIQLAIIGLGYVGLPLAVEFGRKRCVVGFDIDRRRIDELTRVVDVVAELRGYGIAVDVHDPWADAAEARREYGLQLVDQPAAGEYDGMILAVAHDVWRDQGAAALRAFGRPGYVFFDLKAVFAAEESDLRL